MPITRKSAPPPDADRFERKPDFGKIKSDTRSVLTHGAVTGLGLLATEVGLKLGLGQSAASRAAQRGRKMVTEIGMSLEDNRNA